LSTSRVDYSELVIALQENKDGKANELLEELLPRLMDYLKVTMNAGEKEAEECVHQAFLDVFEKIREDKIRNEKYIFSYLLKACRHEYIRYAKHQHRFNYGADEQVDYLVEPADQIKNLLDEERQKILEQCLEELREKSRKFITYFIERPETTTKQAARHFQITGANVRTKKSRILSRLHHCFKRKSNE